MSYLALPLLRKPKASTLPQPAGASSSAGETSKIIHAAASDEGKALGETSDPKRSPVKEHQASSATSRTETPPDPLPADDEEIATISSAAQAEIPELTNDQAQYRPGQYENESNGTNTGQRRGDSTEVPRIRDGGPVRNGRQVAWTNGGDDWEREDDDEDGGAEKWQQPTSKAIDQHARKFACPFYKRYPDCDDLPKACKKGWSFHRIK